MRTCLILGFEEVGNSPRTAGGGLVVDKPSCSEVWGCGPSGKQISQSPFSGRMLLGHSGTFVGGWWFPEPILEPRVPTCA